MSSPTYTPVVEFHYDIVCPFAYIASLRIEAIAAQSGATVRWCPVLLGGIYKATAAPQGKDGSASDVFNQAKKDVFSRQFARTLRRFGIPIDYPSAHPLRTVDALRLLHGIVANDQRACVSHALFKAYWVDGINVADRNAILEVAQNALDSTPGAPVIIDKAAFDDPKSSEELERATAEIVTRGAPGVPAFWIPDEKWIDFDGERRIGRLYWGQDRMHFAHASLLKLSGRLSANTKMMMLLPRCRPLQVLQEPVKLEFWFDFSSPWSYLGWTHLDRLRRTFGSKLEIELKPILLGVLFREIGSPQMPSLAMSQQRRLYQTQDMADWGRFWMRVDRQEGASGQHLAIRWPDVFPIRSPALLRCAIVDPSCIPVIYRACWALNANMSDEAVLRTVLNNAGYDSDDLLEQANGPAAREILTANTKFAKDAGFCGMPTFQVFHRESGDGEWKQNGGFVWGQDELAVVQDLISGWDEKESNETATLHAEDKGRL